MAATHDPSTRWPGVRFTPTERSLLTYLLERAGEVVSRADLLREVWGYAPGARTRTVQTTIERVRRKIEEDPSHPQHLLTVRGRGYVLVRSSQDPREAGGRTAVLKRLLDSLDADEVVWIRTGRGRGNLHRSVAPLFGRGAQLDEIAGRLNGGARLVCLVGPGGVGKTRLGREVVVHVDGFEGGRWFIDLSGSRTPEEAWSAVVRAMGLVLPSHGRTSPSQAVGAVLAAQEPTLLLLDNLEQLPAAFAQQVLALLRVAPRASVLATSRAHLGVAGEVSIRVDPLDIEPAAKMLAHRLDRVRPRVCTPEELIWVARIAELLEGMPIAMELAASRARLVPLRELFARLGQSLRALGGGGAGPARHSSLWATLQWSWDLLGDEERTAMVHLTAFRGGCSLEAASTVLAGVVGEPLDVLASLHDHSMIVVVHGADGARLRHLESLRAFTADRVSGAAVEAAMRAMAEWAQDFAVHHSERAFTTPGSLAALTSELPNLVGAWDWLHRRDPDAAVKLLRSLWPAFDAEGQPVDLADMARRTRDGVRSSHAHGVLHTLIARASFFVDHEASWTEARRGRERVARSSHEFGLLSVVYAGHLLWRERPDEARSVLQEALEGAIASGDEPLRAMVLVNLGAASASTGDLEGQVEHYRQAYAVAVGAGRRVEAGRAGWRLADSLASTGAFDEAQRVLAEAEAHFSSVDHRIGARLAQEVRATLTVRQGRYEDAHALFSALLVDHHRWSYGNSSTLPMNAGYNALLVGRWSEGRALLEPVWERELAGRRARVRTRALCALIAACAMCGDLERTRELRRVLEESRDEASPGELWLLDVAARHAALLELRFGASGSDAAVELEAARALLSELEAVPPGQVQALEAPLLRESIDRALSA